MKVLFQEYGSMVIAAVAGLLILQIISSLLLAPDGGMASLIGAYLGGNPETEEEISECSFEEFYTDSAFTVEVLKERVYCGESFLLSDCLLAKDADGNDLQLEVEDMLYLETDTQEGREVDPANTVKQQSACDAELTLEEPGFYLLCLRASSSLRSESLYLPLSCNSRYREAAS